MKQSESLDKRMLAEGFISVQLAAERTGVSESTLYKALKDGEVQGLDVGRRRYLKIESLLAYVGEGGRMLFKRSVQETGA